MSQSTKNSPANLLPIRVETLSPEYDWPEIWRIARIKGLVSHFTSFLFKLLHGLIPIQDRVHRLVVAAGDQPGLCQLCHVDVEDPLHALFSCHLSQVLRLGMLGYAQKTVPNLSQKLPSNKEELITVSLLATGWLYTWEARTKKKQNEGRGGSNDHYPQEE